MTRLALLIALLSLTLTTACIPSRQPPPPSEHASAPAPQTGPLAQHERPIMATVTVTGRERCPSTHDGYGFAGSQRQGDTATCFYR